MHLLFTALEPGSTGRLDFRLASVDLVGLTADVVLIEDEQGDIGTVTISLTDGSITGSFADLSTVQVELMANAFTVGDVVRSDADGTVYVVFGTSVDYAQFYSAPGSTAYVHDSGVFAKIGHVDVTGIG